MIANIPAALDALERAFQGVRPTLPPDDDTSIPASLYRLAGLVYVALERGPLPPWLLAVVATAETAATAAVIAHMGGL